MGIIYHSNAGSQYTSSDLRSLIEQEGITGLIGTVGDAYDNGLMESTIGLYKVRRLTSPPDRTFDDWQDVEKATAAWGPGTTPITSTVLSDMYHPLNTQPASIKTIHRGSPKPKRLKPHLTQTPGRFMVYLIQPKPGSEVHVCRKFNGLTRVVVTIA